MEMEKEECSNPRSHSCCRGSIVVVAKCPIAGKSKTRLIPLLGSDGSAALANAMLSDVLVNISACVSSPQPSQKILLHAPPTEEGRAMMQDILLDTNKCKNEDENLHLNRRFPDSSPWKLMPMLSSEDTARDMTSSDLGSKLSDALVRARQLQREENESSSSSCSVQRGLFPVVFLGMDSPELPMDEICAALATASSSCDNTTNNPSAVLCPSDDGGYGMLSVPPTACSKRVFGLGDSGRMLWSHPLTALCQIKALTDLGVPVRIGRLMHDMDEPKDVLALCRRLQVRISSAEDKEDFSATSPTNDGTILLSSSTEATNFCGRNNNLISVTSPSSNADEWESSLVGLSLHSKGVDTSEAVYS